MKRFLTCLATSLTSSGVLLAQLPTPSVQNLPPVTVEQIVIPNPAPTTAPTPTPSPTFGPAVSLPTASPSASVLDGAFTPHTCSSPRLWASSDYLLWWIQRGPLPVPLVTTSGIASPLGALIDPAAQTVLGQGSGTNHANYGTIPGLRATAGGWLNDQHTIGLEGSGFILQDRSVTYPYVFGGVASPTAAPGLTGAPNLVGERAPIESNAVLVSTQTQLWGAEANGLGRIISRQNGYLDVLAGFRYLDLRENLNIVDTFPGIDTSGNRTVQDTFTTRNQFYGGQLGIRTGVQWRFVTLDATAKVALGSTHEMVDVMGSTTITNGAFGLPSGVTPGGLFAQASNSGRTTHDEFSVVPEAQGRIGFNLTSHMKLYAGYTFLYATDWVRPGNQLDRLPPLTLTPLPGAAIGSATAGPLPVFNRGDFFAHGVNFGLEFKY